MHTLILRIAILVRVPRNSIHITVALRVRFRDNACVCLLITKKPLDLAELRSLFIRQQQHLANYPFLLLSLILDYRLTWYDSWLDRLWERVDTLERSTGMTAWPKEEIVIQGTQDYGSMLQKLHAVNVELIVADTTMKFGRTFVDFCEDHDSGRKCSSAYRTPGHGIIGTAKNQSKGHLQRTAVSVQRA